MIDPYKGDHHVSNALEVIKIPKKIDDFHSLFNAKMKTSTRRGHHHALEVIKIPKKIDDFHSLFNVKMKTSTRRIKSIYIKKYPVIQ